MSFTPIDRRSTDASIPGPPTDCVTFLDEALGWEATADERGNIVTISAKDPTADYSTFGEAWGALRTSVSPTNPYIFQYDAGLQIPVDAVSQGLAGQIPIRPIDHPGGLVVRGVGDDTRLMWPQDYIDYIDTPIGFHFGGTVISVDSARMLITKCSIGFYSGGYSSYVSKADYELYNSEGLLGVDGCTNICMARDADIKAGGDFARCASGSAYTFGIQSTGGNQAGIVLHDCTLHNQWDLGFVSDVAEGTNTDDILIVYENCRIFTYGREVGRTAGDPMPPTQQDSLWANRDKTQTMVRNCTIEGTRLATFVFSPFTPSNSQKSRTGSPCVLYVEDCTLVVDLPYLGQGGGRPLIQAKENFPAGMSYVIRDCTWEITSQELNGAHTFTGWGSATPEINLDQCDDATVGVDGYFGAFIQWGPGDANGECEDGSMWIVNNSFSVDLTGVNAVKTTVAGYNDSSRFIGRVYCCLDGQNATGDRSGARLYDYDNKFIVKGPPEDTAWYVDRVNSTDTGFGTVEIK